MSENSGCWEVVKRKHKNSKEVQQSVDEAEAQQSVDEAEVQQSVDEAEVQQSVDEAEAQQSVDEAEAQQSVDEAEVQQSVYEAAVEIRKRFHFFCRRSRYMKEAETPAKQRPKISRKGGDLAAHWGNLLLDLGLIEKNSLQWEKDEFQRLYGVTFQQAELVLENECFVELCNRKAYIIANEEHLDNAQYSEQLAEFNDGCGRLLEQYLALDQGRRKLFGRDNFPTSNPEQAAEAFEQTNKAWDVLDKAGRASKEDVTRKGVGGSSSQEPEKQRKLRR